MTEAKDPPAHHRALLVHMPGTTQPPSAQPKVAQEHRGLAQRETEHRRIHSLVGEVVILGGRAKALVSQSQKNRLYYA